MMNDPRVLMLNYGIRHVLSVNYDKAPPLDYEDAAFSVRMEKSRATILLKEHYATVDSARNLAEPFLRAWELSSALFHPTDRFEFVFQTAEVIDRNPTPGGLRAQSLSIASPVISSVSLNVDRSKYPDPPTGLARDLLVELMLDRYCMLSEGRTTLGDAANFCLTALVLSSVGRKKAAERFSIEYAVLKNLGMLPATKGGREARKAVGANTPFTAAEDIWLREVLNRIIRRAAEAAFDPNTIGKQIKMTDLPPI